ncbi:MAG: hypothetical protein GY768_04305 [Planctomycetaceae bacterium]|nr:hypothetical protein [Planctomycetaceae bacterium]
MSLFENDEYQWRETYFILFEEENRPQADQVSGALKELDPRFEIMNVKADDEGRFESLTLVSPDDYAAMDISFVVGDEVVEQTTELIDELLKATFTEDEKAAIRSLGDCRCRFDVYHFEQLTFVGRDGEGEEDDFMDPGALLTVMEKIAEVADGVIVDPQANTIL